MHRKLKRFLGNSWRIVQKVATLVFEALAASGEAILHNNLGSRYMPKAFLALILCCVYSLGAPKDAVWIRVFLLGFFLRVIYHFISISLRPFRGLQEPHSYSTGDPWRIWSRWGVSRTTVLRYLEPGLCVLLAWIMPSREQLLATWIGGCGISLFIKEQQKRIKMHRRVLDMADSRIESQALSSAVNQYVTPRRPGREATNRPRLPGSAATRGR